MRKLRGHLFVPSNRGNRFKSLFCGCTDESDEFAVFEAIANREGSREMFRNHSGEYLLETLDDFLHFHSVGNEVLRRRLADLGVRIKEPDLRYVVTSDLEYLGRLIAIGFDPRAVTFMDYCTSAQMIAAATSMQNRLLMPSLLVDLPLTKPI